MALIKTYNSVPSVYTHQSRDFQLIGHIFEAVFNSSKLATDMLDKMMPNADFDERMLNLSATTVGFIRKHEYDALDLTMILNSFAHLLRIKGTKSSIEFALNILLRSQGISDKYIINIDSKNKILTLYLSERLEDVVLLTDLFDYILPFGFNYRIIQSSIVSATGFPTKVDYQDVSASGEFITNEGIVNDTFKTTIEKVEPTVIDPRPIKNGEIVSPEPEPTSGPYLSVTNASVTMYPLSMNGYVDVEWRRTPVIGNTYNVSISINTVNDGVGTSTISYTPSTNNGLYYWTARINLSGEYIDVTSTADGTKIELVAPGIGITGATLSVTVSETN